MLKLLKLNSSIAFSIDINLKYLHEKRRAGYQVKTISVKGYLSLCQLKNVT